MIIVRKSAERGHFNHGWLNTYHTFSFGEYRDPRQMGFRNLRVINEDWIAAGKGFDTHGHRDMEIVTYVIDGELAHRDSMGNGSRILPGDVQRMSAGRGVLHSEANGSATTSLHLLQIWILPRSKGIAPSYEQKNFSVAEKLNRLRLVASSDGREGSVLLHQDACIYASVLEAGNGFKHELKPGRGAWMQLISGTANLNGIELKPGDGAAAVNETELAITTRERAELLLFDLA